MDTVRFFRGDMPAHEFEAGHNRGSNYPCTACQTKVYRYDDLTHAFCMKMITYKATKTLCQKVMHEREEEVVHVVWLSANHFSKEMSCTVRVKQ